MKSRVAHIQSANASAHHHFTTSTRNDIYFKLTSPLWCFKFQRPCQHAARLKAAEKCHFFLFERYVTTHWCDLWHNPLATHTPPPPPQNPAPSWAVYGGPCVHERPRLPPQPCPFRCKQHCVCHLQFRGRPFCLTDLGLFLSAFAGFFVSFQEMKKAVPSPSINKQLCE